MQPLDRWEILESAHVAEEEVVTEHFTRFVNSFVQKDRRERWLHLLLNRPKQIFGNSHKLHGHLDRSKCSPLTEESPIKPKSQGVYYDFSDEPVILTAAEALFVGPDRDGIFSIIPGELAIYFFHEGENFLFKA